MRTSRQDCTLITDPLTTWRTPWLLIEQRAFEHREAIAFDDRGTLLNAELPKDCEITDESIQWVECDPIRGGDPGFQAHARQLLEDAGKPEKISDEGIALDVAGVVREGGSLLSTLEPEMAVPLERLARWANLNGYQHVSAETHTAIERGEGSEQRALLLAQRTAAIELAALVDDRVLDVLRANGYDETADAIGQRANLIAPPTDAPVLIKFEDDADDVRKEIRQALEGESNDDEHDALVRVAEALGLVERDGAFWDLAKA